MSCCIGESRYCRAMFSSMGEGFIYCKVIFDKTSKAIDFTFIELNEAFEVIIGEKREKAILKPMSYFVRELKEDILQMFGEIARSGGKNSMEYYNERTRSYYKIIAFSEWKGEFAALFIDITESVNRQKYEYKYKKLMESSIDTIFIMDDDGWILEANASAEKLYGYTHEELISMNIWDIRSCKEREKFEAQFEFAKENGMTFETVHRKKDGSEFIVEVSSKSSIYKNEKLVMSIIRDISERKLLEANLEYAANHDFLTKIENRVGLFNKYSIAIERAEKNNKKLAVIFIDIDKFKYVNDIYGHKAGDKVLEQFAIRIKETISNKDILARMGGDEFVIINDEVMNEGSAINLAKKIIDQFKEPIAICENISIQITTSIGIAMFPEDSKDKELLIKYADEAMYAAKKVEGCSYKVYKELNIR